MRHLRVALVAHHANPEWGSEPLIGWQWAKNLDSRVELALVTHVRNRRFIEAAGGLRGQVIYVDTEALAARVNRFNDRLWPKVAVLNRSFLESLALRAFDREACRLIAHAHRERHFDIVHRVSPISVRAGTRLSRLGIPLVLGPLNGGLQTAPGFSEIAKSERAWVQGLRRLSRVTDPWSRDLSHTTSIFVATEAARASLPRRERGRAVLLSENGVDLDRFQGVPARHGRGLKVLYLGRLLPCKGAAFALEAVARLPRESGVEIDVVGDGPDRERIEMLVRDPRLLGRARWHGAVPVKDVPSRMVAADVLCLPSVRESGGGVILEAMACARPVIVMNYGGPAELVRREWGIALDAGAPEELIAGLSETFLVLERDPDRRRQLGESGRRRVLAEHGWEVRVLSMIRHYESLHAARSRLGVLT